MVVVVADEEEEEGCWVVRRRTGSPYLGEERIMQLAPCIGVSRCESFKVFQLINDNLYKLI